MKYCNECRRHVEPVKSQWNWKRFIPLALTVVGGVIYGIYHRFFKKNTRCPHCQTDKLSKFSPEERAENKRKRELRKAKKAAEAKGSVNRGRKEAEEYRDEIEELLNEADRAYQNSDSLKAVKLMEKAIDVYDDEDDEVIKEAFPLYTKKARYLYESGRNDEAWGFYNDIYVKCNEDRRLLAQLFEEKAKMLEYEGRHLGALREEVMAKINRDWNLLEEDREEDIDFEWTEDRRFEILAEEGGKGHRWEEAREVLVQAYDDLENLEFAEVNKEVQKILKKS